MGDGGSPWGWGAAAPARRSWRGAHGMAGKGGGPGGGCEGGGRNAPSIPPLPCLCISSSAPCFSSSLPIHVRENRLPNLTKIIKFFLGFITALYFVCLRQGSNMPFRRLVMQAVLCYGRQMSPHRIIASFWLEETFFKIIRSNH